jgi:hypothetical protein
LSFSEFTVDTIHLFLEDFNIFSPFLCLSFIISGVLDSSGIVVKFELNGILGFGLFVELIKSFGVTTHEFSSFGIGLSFSFV